MKKQQHDLAQFFASFVELAIRKTILGSLLVMSFLLPCISRAQAPDTPQKPAGIIAPSTALVPVTTVQGSGAAKFELFDTGRAVCLFKTLRASTETVNAVSQRAGIAEAPRKPGQIVLEGISNASNLRYFTEWRQLFLDRRPAQRQVMIVAHDNIGKQLAKWILTDAILTDMRSTQPTYGSQAPSYSISLTYRKIEFTY